MAGDLSGGDQHGKANSLKNTGKITHGSHIQAEIGGFRLQSVHADQPN
jgi:hypothetical protein